MKLLILLVLLLSGCANYDEQVRECKQMCSPNGISYMNAGLFGHPASCSCRNYP